MVYFLNRKKINLIKTDLFEARTSSNFNFNRIIRRSFETYIPPYLRFYYTFIEFCWKWKLLTSYTVLFYWDIINWSSFMQYNRIYQNQCAQIERLESQIIKKLGSNKTKGPKRVVNIGYDHLCPREENRSFINNSHRYQKYKIINFVQPSDA